jgi:SAM-dependent methyltransferase
MADATVERLDVARSGPAARDRSPWWGVHASRYRFAAPYVRGRRVLDIACGTGYGLTILHEQGGGRTVIGVDADFGAARAARRCGPALVADGARLPFQDRSFDVVTSFETLEHLHEREAFLSELARVLTPGGVCLLSTPNALQTQPLNGTPRNPFHVHEYTPDELRASLTSHFASVEMLGQDLDRRFVISPFWDDQQRLPRTAGMQARLLAWKILNRFPAAVGEPASRALLGQPLVPDENDYHFTAADLTHSQVLVAVCGPAVH